MRPTALTDSVFMLSVMISVIVPVYNREDLVSETIDSVLKQTYLNWELILVDDGSTDNTWVILESYSKRDARIKAFKRDREPKNANTCRNIGAVNARGRYFVFLDSDDLLLPTTLEERINSIEKVKEDFILRFSHRLVDGKTVARRTAPPESPLLIRVQFLTGIWPYNTPSLFIKKEVFHSVGMFDENLSRMQDPDLYLRLTNSSYGFVFSASKHCDTLIRSYKRSEGTPKNHIFSSFSYFLDKYLNQLAENSEEAQLFRLTINKFVFQLITLNKPKDLLSSGIRSSWTKIANHSRLKFRERMSFYLIVSIFVFVPSKLGYRLSMDLNNLFFKSNGNYHETNRRVLV
jgi:glycosyltransferase involved in cell wall biosynthesis